MKAFVVNVIHRGIAAGDELINRMLEVGEAKAHCVTQLYIINWSPTLIS